MVFLGAKNWKGFLISVSRRRSGNNYVDDNFHLLYNVNSYRHQGY